jgi:hypothetical protein
MSSLVPCPGYRGRSKDDDVTIRNGGSEGEASVPGSHRADGNARQEVVSGFGRALAQLRELHGSPSFARMQAAVRHIPNVAGSKNTFHRMVSNPDRIYEPEYVRGFVLALGLKENDVVIWERRRLEAMRQYQAREGTAAAAPTLTKTRRRRRPVIGLAGVGVAVALLASASNRATLPPTGASAPRTTSASGIGISGATNPVARFVGASQAVIDDADPKRTRCAADSEDVSTLDHIEIDTARQEQLGIVELRHSRSCNASWGRFTPSDRLIYLHLDAVVTISAFRPGTRTKGRPFSVHFDGQPVYGNILLNRSGCVQATVEVVSSGGGGRATTACAG